MEADMLQEKSGPSQSKKSRQVAKLLKMKRQSSAAEQKPGLQVQWQLVDLSDINLTDTSFQYRLSTPTADIRGSLQQHGQEQPVDLIGCKPYRIVDGFRRCKAAYDLGWTSVKAYIHDMNDQGAMRMAFTKNVLRKNLSPMDRAHALWVTQERGGMTRTALQQLFGLSDKQVRRYLELLDFSPALKRIFDGKLVTMAHAKVLHDFAVESPADWKQRIETDELTAKQLKKLLAKEVPKKPGRKKLYLRQTKDSLRVYPFAVNKDAPVVERQKIARLLRDALEFLET